MPIAETNNIRGPGRTQFKVPRSRDERLEVSGLSHVLRDEMRRLNRPHLLSGQQAFTYGAKNAFPMDATFAGKTFDIVNDHPLPNTLFDGKVYEMGNFMSKELRLIDLPGERRSFAAGVINAGGSVAVSSGGSLLNPTLSSGGVLNLLGSAVEVGGTVASGFTITAQGTTSFPIVIGSYGTGLAQILVPASVVRVCRTRRAI